MFRYGLHLKILQILTFMLYFPTTFGSSFENKTISQDWQKVEGFEEKFYLYSAFYEYNGGVEGRIRIIGATVPFSNRTVYCHLYDDNKKFQDTVAAFIVTARHPSRQLSISPVFIFCKLYSLKILPSYISISATRFNKNVRPTNLVQVLSNDLFEDTAESVTKFKFSACVQPTYKYEDPLQLVQWMEFQIMMGVEHFTFYNISIGPQSSCVMRSYGDSMVKILPWKEISHLSELHHNGQVLQATDCVLRYRGLSKYLVMLDYDEYIISNPLTEIVNYEQLINYALENLNYTNLHPVQFQFRSGLFGLGFKQFKHPDADKRQENETEIQIDDLFLYKYVERLKNIKPFNFRSKFITMPEFVLEPGIHSMVTSILKNGIELLVPSDIAYIHHYRKCWWADDCGGKLTYIDTNGHLHTQPLLDRVRKKFNSLKVNCGLDYSDVIKSLHDEL